MKSLGKNSIYNVIYCIANLLFPLVTSMYASRILLPEGIGRVSYAMNIASYFVAFSAMGIPSYGIREIAKCRDAKEEKNKLFSELFYLNFISSLFFFAVYAVMITLLLGFQKQWLLHACCGMLVLFNCFNIDWLYSGQEEYGYIVCRSIVIKVISILALVMFVHTENDYVIYALITCFGTVGNYFFNIIHSRKYVRLVFHGLNFARHLKAVFILGLNLLLASLYNKIDVTMLGIFSSEAATGLYSNSHKIIEIIITACIAVTTAFLPRLSYYYQNNRQKFHDLIHLGIEVISLFAFPAFIGIIILGPQAVQLLYGKEFLPAGVTVRIFSALILIRGFGDLLGFQAVMATGNERKRLAASTIGGAVNILLNALLIKRFQQNGVAFASVISELCVNLYLIYTMRRIIQYTVPVKSILQCLFASVIMGLVVVALQLLPLNMIGKCVVSVFVGAVVYFIALILMKNHILTVAFKKYCLQGGHKDA